MKASLQVILRVVNRPAKFKIEVGITSREHVSCVNCARLLGIGQYTYLLGNENTPYWNPSLFNLHQRIT